MSGHKKKSSLDTALRRGASRLAAVQALYQLDMGGGLLDDISRDFLTGVQGGEVIEEDPVMETERPVTLVGLNAEMFTILLRGVDADRAPLDEIINGSLAKGWDAQRLQPLLRNVLRLGIFELRDRKEIPAKAVVSEYVDIARSFFNDAEPGMVNAVLDRVARQFRPEEMPQTAKSSPAEVASAAPDA